MLPPESVFGWVLSQEGHDLRQGCSAADVIPHGPRTEGCWQIELPVAESTDLFLKGDSAVTTISCYILQKRLKLWLSMDRPFCF